jgi:hypothetical protein
MKYFRIKQANQVDGLLTPALSGVNVKGKELFFNNGKCGPNEFYDQNYEFDYLVPTEFGEGREQVKSQRIFDYHTWLDEYPIGAWLNPVSSKFKTTLERFNLAKHRFYPAKVLHKNEFYQYYVLQVFYNLYEEYIDFGKTFFNNLDSSRNLEQSKLIVRQFSSISEVENYAEEHWDWDYNYERIVMKPAFREIDFITFYKLGDLVSERLRDGIRNDELTGIEFIELPIPIEFSDEV